MYLRWIQFRFIEPLQKPFYFELNTNDEFSQKFEKNVGKYFSTLDIPGSKIVFYHKKGLTLQNQFSKNFRNFGHDFGYPGVYRINCKDCGLCYIGETGRPFEIRLEEHKKFIGPTGRNAIFDKKIKMCKKLISKIRKCL